MAAVSVLAELAPRRRSSSRWMTSSGSTVPRPGCSSSPPGGSRAPRRLSALAARRPAARCRSVSTDRCGGRLERDSGRSLSAGALHQLIKARLGGTFSRAALLRIHRATAGNPFFALELASSLLRAGRRRRARRSRFPTMFASWSRAGCGAAGDDQGDAALCGGDAEPDGRLVAARAAGVLEADCRPGSRGGGGRGDHRRR